jgi:hypothetical protein
MRIGLGGLGWPPQAFWKATLTEFCQAIEGRNDANGGKQQVAAPSDGDLQELLDRYG